MRQHGKKRMREGEIKNGHSKTIFEKPFLDVMGEGLSTASNSQNRTRLLSV
jgi:hypothetical protein